MASVSFETLEDKKLYQERNPDIVLRPMPGPKFLTAGPVKGAYLFYTDVVDPRGGIVDMNLSM